MTTENEQLRAEYEEAVKGPGRFEGEAIYVPHFWQQYLEGWSEEDAKGNLKFDVTATDKELFPELKRRKVVKLWQSNDGFICEV